jgi:hypothetical protein
MRHRNSMKYIRPDGGQPDGLVLTRELGALLLSPWCKNFLSAQAGKKAKNGVRRINGNRVELFLDKDSSALQLLVSKAARRTGYCKRWNGKTDQLVAALCGYATLQANRDDRPPNPSSRSHQNFSVIISYEPVVAQVAHVDMAHPNWQYGMTLSGPSPSTLVYDVPAPQMITTAAAFFKALITHNGGPPLPASGWNVRAYETAQKFVEKYGNVLAVYFHSIRGSNKQNVETGTLMSLPGGVVHAGPPSTANRAVLFFSSSQEGTESYDSNEQYNAATLLHTIVWNMWSSVRSIKKRRWLLAHLIHVSVGMALRHSKECVLDHIDESDCKDYLQSILEDDFERFKDVETRMDRIQHDLSNFAEKEPGCAYFA